MNLFILRHASAGTRRLNPLLDAKRPLDKEGKEHCLHLAHVLNALKVTFDLVVSSPLKRSLQTAQLVATETGYEAQILHLQSACARGHRSPISRRCCDQANGTENMLVVGHSPNLQLFLGSLLVRHRAREDCRNDPADSPAQRLDRTRLRSRADRPRCKA